MASAGTAICLVSSFASQNASPTVCKCCCASHRLATFFLCTPSVFVLYDRWLSIFVCFTELCSHQGGQCEEMKGRGEFELEGRSPSYLPALICGVGRRGFKQTNPWSSYAQLCRGMRGKVERRRRGAQIGFMDGTDFATASGGNMRGTSTYSIRLTSRTLRVQF